MKYILIPIKQLSQSKHRLTGLMTPKERSELACLMMEHLFREVAQANGYDRVAVVTLDTAAAELTRRFNFQLIKETQQTSESASVDYGSRIVTKQGARSVLRLPIDLPLVTAEDIENILARVNDQPAALLAPSRDGTGTNAIVRTPPDLFPSCFGPNSLAKHIQQARRFKVPCELIHLPNIALDLDEPGDVASVLECGSGTDVYEFLISLRIDERLARAPVGHKMETSKFETSASWDGRLAPAGPEDST